MLAFVLTLYFTSGATTSSTKQAMDVNNKYRPIKSYELCVELAKEQELRLNSSIELNSDIDHVTVVCKRIPDKKQLYKKKHEKYKQKQNESKK